MKKILTAMLIACLCACSPNKYVIKGHITGLEGKVYLLDDTGVPIDSTTVEKGSFRMKGAAETPQLCYLTALNSQTQFGILLFTEPGSISIEGDITNPAIYAVGTPLNDANAEYSKINNDLRSRFRTPGITPEERAALDDQLSEASIKAFEDNPNNLFGALILTSQLAYEMSGRELLDAIARFPEQLQQHKLLTELRRNAEAKLRTEVGQPYIDVMQNNPAGNPVQLRSVIENPANKYVLVDFWASWCMPCMAEVPHLVEAYKAYHKKGFEIYGISFDNDRERWTAAIDGKGMNWIHVSDLNRFDNQAAFDYAVRSIPSNFLIDCTTGQIVAVNLRGEELPQKIAELLR